MSAIFETAQATARASKPLQIKLNELLADHLNHSAMLSVQIAQRKRIKIL